MLKVTLDLENRFFLFPVRLIVPETGPGEWDQVNLKRQHQRLFVETMTCLLKMIRVETRRECTGSFDRVEPSRGPALSGAPSAQGYRKKIVPP